MTLDPRPAVHDRLLLILVFALGVSLGLSIPRAEAGASAEVSRG